MTVQFDEDSQNRRVKDLRVNDEEGLAESYARQNGVAYTNLAFTAINMDGLRIITEARAREANAACYNVVDKKIWVAVLAPQNPVTIKLIEELRAQGYEPTISMVSIASLEKAWGQYKDLSFAQETKAGSLEISNDEIDSVIGRVKTKDDVKTLIDQILGQTKGYRISKILEIILAGALATKASDIHIEPEEDYVRLRYRLDGVLNTILEFDRSTYNLLLSRVKLLSGLKLNIKSEAQDGRFSVRLKDYDIEIRTSMLPGAYSESIVLRLLNPKSISVPLDELGFDPKLLDILTKLMARPSGLILTTGPTGSGKTTTLYACLKKIHTPDLKIITIEDPIEYHLQGIVQTQTDSEKGYTFLAGLRAALRQDPDIIMVGEIRDGETAEIAINSALTGHLVFSTLHTNNAAGTFPRLISLGVNSKVISSAVSVSMAQRLVRKLCPHCKKEMPIEGETRALFQKIIDSIYDKSYVMEVKTMFVPGGCVECNNLGYRGRVGIYEAILLDAAVELVINSDPTERDIQKAAAPQGILNMKQEGVLKILKGLTSLDEMTRIIDLEDHD